MNKLSITTILLFLFTVLYTTSCKEEDFSSQVTITEDNLTRSKRIINSSQDLKEKTVLWENSFYSYKDKENWILNVPIQPKNNNEVEKIVIYSSEKHLETVLWSYKSHEPLNTTLAFKNHNLLSKFTGEVSYLDLKTSTINRMNYFKGNMIVNNSRASTRFGGGICGKCHNGLGEIDNPIELDPVVVTPTKPWWEMPDLIPPITIGPVTVPSIKEALKNKPFAFTDVPCDIVKEWLETVRKEVAKTLLDKLKNIAKKSTTRGGITTETVANLQNINDAHSKVINLDYFSTTVDQLPFGGGGRRLTPQQLLEHIRKNMNSFVNNSYAEFTPYKWNGINDTNLWNSSNPYGAVIGIDMLGPDNGSVMVTNYSPNGWTFSTIFDPKYGAHPVSGHRDFGFIQNANGSYTFYTRGADRLTDAIDNFLKPIAFGVADRLWESFQNKINDYVNSHGGRSRVNKPKIIRPDWEKIKEVLDGKKPLSTLSNDCK